MQEATSVQEELRSNAGERAESSISPSKNRAGVRERSIPPPGPYSNTAGPCREGRLLIDDRVCDRLFKPRSELVGKLGRSDISDIFHLVHGDLAPVKGAVPRGPDHYRYS